MIDKTMVGKDWNFRTIEISEILILINKISEKMKKNQLR